MTRQRRTIETSAVEVRTHHETLTDEMETHRSVRRHHRRAYAAGVRPIRRNALQSGRALRYFRIEQRRWTQAQLARHAKVSVNSVGRLETRGVRDPRIYLKLRRALGVSEDDVQRWIAARPIDKRLVPLVVWFEQLPARDQDVVGQALILLLNRRT